MARPPGRGGGEQVTGSSIDIPSRPSIFIQEDGSEIMKFRAPKTAEEVLTSLQRRGKDGELIDRDGCSLLGNDSLEAGYCDFKQFNAPSTTAPTLTPVADGENPAKRLKIREEDGSARVSEGVVVPNPVPGAENLQRGPHPATELFHRICDAVGNAVGKTFGPSSAFADPKTYVKLPFPSVDARKTPPRFLCDSDNYWNYMGRKKYREVRNAILSLQVRSEKRIIEPDENLRPSSEASLWGNMGSGKSYILAAVVCELLYSFHKHSRVKVDAGELQTQRVIYLPDCSHLLSDAIRLSYFKAAFLLGYADDEKVVKWVEGVKDQKALVDFVGKEKDRGVFLFIIVDQENALDLKGPDVQLKINAREAISSLIVHGGILKGASANNDNAQRWFDTQSSTRKVFLYGGLDADEYKEWRGHLETRAGKMECGSIKKDQEAESVRPALLQLSKEEEDRVLYDTGCLPLFLPCWSKITTPEKAWREFFQKTEISAASVHLGERMDKQLSESNESRASLTDMYRYFLTGRYVDQGPNDYDSRYLYRSTDPETFNCGECVCGVVKRIIAEHLQKLRR